MGRPRTGGDGRKSKLYVRTSVSYAHKAKVIDVYEECADLSETITRIYGELSHDKLQKKKKQVRKWLYDRANIRAMCANGKGRMHKRRKLGDGTVLTKEAEEQIVLWINSVRREGIPVSSMMLQIKAVEIAKDAGVSREIFRASTTWRRRFLRRHRFSIRARTRQGRTTPLDAQQVAQAFTAAVRQATVEQGIYQIFNADQTAVFFEYVPRTTIDQRNTKTVWVKCGGKERERATAMILADSDGNKAPPFLVFKSRAVKPATRAANAEHRHGFGRRLWSEIAPLQAATGCRIYGNQTGWWNSSLSIAFLEFHFAERTNRDDPVLLLWDDFSGHWTDEVVRRAAALSVVLMKVPPRYTYVCQPADISWNKPLKDALRRRWVVQMTEQIAKFHQDAVRVERASAVGSRKQSRSAEESQTISGIAQPPSTSDANRRARDASVMQAGEAVASHEQAARVAVPITASGFGAAVADMRRGQAATAVVISIIFGQPAVGATREQLLRDVEPHYILHDDGVANVALRERRENLERRDHGDHLLRFAYQTLVCPDGDRHRLDDEQLAPGSHVERQRIAVAVDAPAPLATGAERGRADTRGPATDAIASLGSATSVARIGATRTTAIGSAQDARERLEASDLERQEYRCSHVGEDDDSASDSADNQPLVSTWRKRNQQSQAGAFQLAAPTRTDIATWIAEEWAGLTTATITSGFKRIGLLNDTRSEPPEQNLLDDVRVLLAAMSRLALSHRINSEVCSDDDIRTAGEESESSEDGSE